MWCYRFTLNILLLKAEEYSRLTPTLPYLLMTCHFASLGHQNLWYWLCRQNESFVFHRPIFKLTMQCAVDNHTISLTQAIRRRWTSKAMICAISNSAHNHRKYVTHSGINSINELLWCLYYIVHCVHLNGAVWYWLDQGQSNCINGWYGL